MKIVIVAQYYPPEPVPIPHALAHELANRGHQVRVITAYPNYPQGRLYDGFVQRAVHVENDGSVRVRRVPIFVSHSNNALGRVANYLSYGLGVLFAGGFARGADIVYVYATQMSAAIAPTWWQVRRKIPFILHVQDLWPESITGSSMVNRRVIRLISAVLSPWLRSTYRRAAATIAIAPTMSRLLEERGAPSDRLHTVFNWADEREIGPVNAELTPGKGMNLLYAGNLGELQDLETVVRAAGQVSDIPGLVVHIVGSGIAEARLLEIVRSERIRGLPWADSRRADGWALPSCRLPDHIVEGPRDICRNDSVEVSVQPVACDSRDRDRSW